MSVVLTMADTSVLLAACVPAHPNYERSIAALEPVVKAGMLILSAHSLLETYSTLTTLPTRPRITTNEAHSVIRQYAEKARVISLSSTEYLNVIRECAIGGLSGGVVYDALNAAVARKATVKRLLTFNTKDFLRAWLEGQDIIRQP